MSFSIGSSNLGMGPRGAMEAFGAEEAKGEVYNPHLFKRLLELLSPYKGHMAIAGILMLAESGLTLLIPLLMKTAIDSHISA